MPASDQHYPILSLQANGAEVDPSLVREIVVKDYLSTPDTAVVKLVQPSVHTSSGATPPDIIDDRRFDLGTEIEVKAGAIDDTVATTIFKGTIVSLEPEFTAQQSSLLLRAYDSSFFMNQEAKSRTFQNMTISDVASKLLQEHGLRPSVDPLTTVHDFLYQANETDWAFLQRIARVHNLELLVSGATANFKKVDRDRAEAVTLRHQRAGEEAGRGVTALLEFAPRASLAQQPRSVEVRFWDSKQGKAAHASAPLSGAQTLAKTGGFTPSNLSGKAKAGTMTVSGRVANQSDANDRATALAARLADAGVQATGTAMGEPKLKAGEKVKIEGVGTRFSGTYVLSSTTHVYRQGGAYRTKFAITGRNASTLVELLGGGGASANGNGGRSWAQGLVVGVVSNTADPDGLGRVRVKFPTLTDEHEGWWARIATAHAGKDRGLYFLPEVGDEVVVGFEQADITRPYVLGSLFNGAAKPPPWVYGKGKDSKLDGSLLVTTPKRFAVHARDKVVMKSDDNHEFEAGKNAVHKAGQDFTIDAKGASIYKSGKTITIESGPMQKIVVKAGGDLELTAGGPAGKVKITGGSVDITGQMAVNVKAPSLNLG